ncbi:MAG TPA: hypothetical protein PKD90_11340 [Phnomibacter sp.]|nr:hypothetical protein [Phnomibacter sp.]
MTHLRHQPFITAATLLLFGVLHCLPGHTQMRFSYGGGFEQPRWVIEAGVQGGIMNCVTDIMGARYSSVQGPFSGVTLRKSRPTAGLYGSLFWHDRVGLRLEVNAGSVEGYDSLLRGATSPTAIGRFDRNLNFRSPITEVQLSTELHPFMIMSHGDRETPRFSPYLILGGSWFRFYPRGLTDAGWVDLPPLRLEGQGFAEYPDRPVYKLNAMAWNAGIGFKYEVSPRVVLRFEINKRTTNTDYLDDVSRPEWINPALFFNYLTPAQATLASFMYNRSVTINPPRNTRPRGNINENDAYWSAVFKFGFNLNKSGYYPGSRQSLLRQMRCTKF